MVYISCLSYLSSDAVLLQSTRQVSLWLPLSFYWLGKLKNTGVMANLDKWSEQMWLWCWSIFRLSIQYLSLSSYIKEYECSGYIYSTEVMQWNTLMKNQGKTKRYNSFEPLAFGNKGVSVRLFILLEQKKSIAYGQTMVAAPIKSQNM